MNASAVPVGRRHFCPNRDRTWAGASHIQGDGAAKRKKCHCGAQLATEAGRYGVFTWRADGRYPATDAVHVTRTRVQASAWIAANPGHGYVDRWIAA